MSGLVSACQVRPISTAKTIAGISVVVRSRDELPGRDARRCAGPLQRADEPRQHLVADRRGDRRRVRGQRHVRARSRQRRREIGPDLGEDHHVADVEPGQHDPGKEGAGVELHDRHARDRAVDDQHHRRRDQDAEAAAGRDDARRDLDVVAGAQHRRHGEQAHQRHHGADDAGGGREHRAGDERRHRERRRDARERQVQALEQLLDQVRALDQVAHEHEQRDRDQHVVRHHRVRALHHEVERLLHRQCRALAAVGEPREDHAHAHQRERRRESRA